jgi:hypothetical protein
MDPVNTPKSKLTGATLLYSTDRTPIILASITGTTKHERLQQRSAASWTTEFGAVEEATSKLLQAARSSNRLPEVHRSKRADANRSRKVRKAATGREKQKAWEESAQKDSGPSFNIHLNQLDGTLYKLQAPISKTVEDLKKMVSAESGIPDCELYASYSTDKLAATDTVSDIVRNTASSETLTELKLLMVVLDFPDLPDLPPAFRLELAPKKSSRSSATVLKYEFVVDMKTSCIKCTFWRKWDNDQCTLLGDKGAKTTETGHWMAGTKTTETAICKFDLRNLHAHWKEYAQPCLRGEGGGEVETTPEVQEKQEKTGQQHIVFQTPLDFPFGSLRVYGLVFDGNGQVTDVVLQNHSHEYRQFLEDRLGRVFMHRVDKIERKCAASAESAAGVGGATVTADGRADEQVKLLAELQKLRKGIAAVVWDEDVFFHKVTMSPVDALGISAGPDS